MDRGVCGIDADAMAMRNMMFLNTMGIAAYTYHAKEVAKTLRATALGKTPFKISDEAKLRSFAGKLGLTNDGSTNEIAIAVADAMIAEINSDSDIELSNVLRFAPKSRIDLWRKLGILPGGPLNETTDCVTSSMTNIDGDYVSLAKKALRLVFPAFMAHRYHLKWDRIFFSGHQNRMRLMLTLESSTPRM